MDCPGADVAYEIRNIYDMTPTEIADSNGHHVLSSLLRGYINMNEVTSAYTKLKEFSLRHKADEGKLPYIDNLEIFSCIFFNF